MAFFGNRDMAAAPGAPGQARDSMSAYPPNPATAGLTGANRPGMDYRRQRRQGMTPTGTPTPGAGWQTMQPGQMPGGQQTQPGQAPGAPMGRPFEDPRYSDSWRVPDNGDMMYAGGQGPNDLTNPEVYKRYLQANPWASSSGPEPVPNLIGPANPYANDPRYNELMGRMRHMSNGVENGTLDMNDPAVAQRFAALRDKIGTQFPKPTRGGLWGSGAGQKAGGPGGQMPQPNFTYADYDRMRQANGGNGGIMSPYDMAQRSGDPAKFWGDQAPTPL